jgi:hypothetical protein
MIEYLYNNYNNKCCGYPRLPESAGCLPALIDPTLCSESILHDKSPLFTVASHQPCALLRWGKKREGSITRGGHVLTAT